MATHRRRTLFFAPPPGAPSLAGWALLPLRAFLGFTFCFAGLQKLANPTFFNANSPSSIQAQLIASARLSPVHLLLGHLLRFAVPIGVVIALAELAVGLGALFGLWTRLAALGGALLAFTLFLTVSFHASPYYTGADIVFLFAWLPLLVAGDGGVLSLDAVLASRARREAGEAPAVPVPLEFGTVQQLCGSYADDRCEARGGAPCEIRGCPFLAERAPHQLPRPSVDTDRRALVLGGTVAAALGALGLVLAGAVAGLGRLVGGAKAPSGSQASLTSPPSTARGGSTTTTSGGTAPAGTPIGAARDVPVRGWARFTDPASGDPALVLRPASGTFLAYDAVCPHAGCTVGYSPAADLIVCPCHGSEFNPATGAVEAGPAPHGLRTIPVAEGPNGQLYVDG